MARTSFDPILYDVLERLPLINYAGEVFRVAPEGADPTAFSSGGGRWGFPGTHAAPTSILYTSETSDGAVAEVVSYYKLLTPMPSKALVLHRISVSLDKVYELDHGNLSKLGVLEEEYPEREYRSRLTRTQEIGATINFLGLHGFFAPSARFASRNLMILADNFPLDAQLDVLSSTPFDWRQWDSDHGGGTR